jgi:hypothetical protein
MVTIHGKVEFRKRVVTEDGAIWRQKDGKSSRLVVIVPTSSTSQQRMKRLVSNGVLCKVKGEEAAMIFGIFFPKHREPRKKKSKAHT